MDSATRQLASQNNIQTSSCGIWGIIITAAIAIYAKIVGPSDSSRFAFSILAMASHVSASALKQLGFVEFPLYASANAINKTEEECDTLAKWFSTHYHCLYVPPYRESQKKNANGNPYLPLGWALRFTGTFMAQPEYYDTLINLHSYLQTRIPSWRDDPIIAKLIIGEDNGFSD